MTQEEINKKHEQQLKINTVLDYTKWSFERRRDGKPHDHATWQKARDYALLEQHTRNIEANRKFLAGLQEKKDAEARQHEREIDVELLPQKQRLMRQWLSDHPDLAESDFESKAWIHLRQNLVEERTDAAREAEIKRQLATGRY